MYYRTTVRKPDLWELYYNRCKLYNSSLAIYNILPHDITKWSSAKRAKYIKWPLEKYGPLIFPDPCHTFNQIFAGFDPDNPWPTTPSAIIAHCVCHVVYSCTLKRPRKLSRLKLAAGFTYAIENDSVVMRAAEYFVVCTGAQ